MLSLCSQIRNLSFVLRAVEAINEFKQRVDPI